MASPVRISTSAARGQGQCGPQSLEAIGLVGPHARFQPAVLIGVVHVDRAPVEAAACRDGRDHGGDRRVATRPAREAHGRRATDGTAGFVGVVVAVEQQVEPGARADVEVGERADLVGEQPEGGQQEVAASDLVGLRAARRQQADEPSRCAAQKRRSAGTGSVMSGAGVRFG